MADYRDISTLHNWEHNPRSMTKDGLARLIKQIKKLGVYKPLVITEDGTVLGGNMRLQALKEMGEKKVWVSVVEADTEEQKIEYALSDNDRVGQYDKDMLANMVGNFPDVEWGDFGVDFEPPVMVGDLMNTYSAENGEKGNLQANFIIPPFSILDARQGYWIARKQNWIGLGLESEIGRDEGLLGKSKLVGTINNGTSIFDPVLCEIMYKWFCVDGGLILDPFAGGSVRGIIANYLGYQYIGNDLAEKQIIENRKQAENILKDKPQPVWHIGDSTKIDTICEGTKSDLIFSCPPYADLEVYSDDPNDLSNMPYDKFKEMYSLIIKKSVSLLKDNRFAIFVVGDIRDKAGFYRNFVSDTITAFIQSGMQLYNEAILITSIGTLPIRVARSFPIGRKLGKTHQNVLIFYKGDPKKIKENYGEIDLSGVEELISEQTMKS